MIQGECSVCRRVFKVDDRYAGMTGRCKACGAAIHVPGQLDAGLDGLPALAPLQATPGAVAPQAPQAAASQPSAEGARPASEGSGPSPAEPPPASPHPADELSRPRDVRARYEPTHGPTPLEGSWLRQPAPAEAATQAVVPDGESEPVPTVAPSPRERLAGRLITKPEPEPSPTHHRPVLVVVQCLALATVAAVLAVHLVSAGIWGQVAAGLGLLLGVLGIGRSWAARWDGLLAGALLCVCAGAAAQLPSQEPAASVIVLASACGALLLVVLGPFRRSSREYFMR